MKTSESVIEISKALCAAQKDMRPALKDSNNPYFKSKYSDLTSVWESVRVPLTSNGISVWQDITTSDKSISVTTRVAHISGEWIEFGPFTIPLMKSDAQSIGSASSYAKRYALCAAVGVVSDDDVDDDAERITERSNIKPQSKKSDFVPINQIVNHPFIPITKEEWMEFQELLKYCSPDHQKTVWEYLQSQNIFSENEVDKILLEKLMRGAHKNINKFKEN